MVKRISVLSVCFICGLFLGCKVVDSPKKTPIKKVDTTDYQKAINEFKNLEALNWQEVFYDSGKDDWTQNWELDGLKATINNTDMGMDFFAGPIAKEDASHAVLWTKKVFKGDLRIDYEFTKIDDASEAVNIIYILASGSGAIGYDHDISKWSEKRRIPKMKLYFNHMNTYHISYAAFDITNLDSNEDYIKLRRYIPEAKKGLMGTDFKPLYTRTGLFKKGILNKISIIKKGAYIYMKIKNSEKEFLCQWNINEKSIIDEGRIGLRHMWTRGSRYQNFRVSELNPY